MATASTAIGVTKMDNRHAWLSWTILKHKVIYYRPDRKYLKKRGKPISDAEYDELEKEYLESCEKNNLPNTLVHKSYDGKDVQGMMEIDLARPSVKYMIRYLRGEYE